ncbi:hypothetical protein B0H17DRAFT_1205334 [Mycena rosella]|uniref:Uncharacterized protein n=1 Tax=Mycena rosella TaxID=1033263 RepID=A0AAD7GE32_MYCRO|nr:hypothetical protein B0H17DRAFT_1205334 [Mycena rosella]
MVLIARRGLLDISDDNIILSRLGVRRTCILPSILSAPSAREQRLVLAPDAAEPRALFLCYPDAWLDQTEYMYPSLKGHGAHTSRLRGRAVAVKGADIISDSANESLRYPRIRRDSETEARLEIEEARALGLARVSVQRVSAKGIRSSGGRCRATALIRAALGARPAPSHAFACDHARNCSFSAAHAGSARRAWRAHVIARDRMRVGRRAGIGGERAHGPGAGGSSAHSADGARTAVHAAHPVVYWMEGRAASVTRADRQANAHGGADCRTRTTAGGFVGGLACAAMAGAWARDTGCGARAGCGAQRVLSAGN